jgi:hypothetical protein
MLMPVTDAYAAVRRVEFGGEPFLMVDSELLGLTIREVLDKVAEWEKKYPLTSKTQPVVRLSRVTINVTEEDLLPLDYDPLKGMKEELGELLS